MEDEREQIEQLRTWWSDNGNYVIAGVVVGVAALVGTNWYKSNRLEAALAASTAYSELADAIEAGEVATAESLADTLTGEHAGSAYAAQARLAMARLYMDLNRDEDAATALAGLLDSNASEEYRDVARLRLARIRLYQDRPNDVLELLGEPPPAGEGEGEEDGAFAARYDEVRGDAYVALGRLDDAREAYRRSLSEAAREATINQELVQLKLLDLPVEPVPAADAPADAAAPAAPAPGDENAPDSAEAAPGADDGKPATDTGEEDE